MPCSWEEFPKERRGFPPPPLLGLSREANRGGEEGTAPAQVRSLPRRQEKGEKKAGSVFFWFSGWQRVVSRHRQPIWRGVLVRYCVT